MVIRKCTGNRNEQKKDKNEQVSVFTSDDSVH